jgi:short-subunit dehydrogenase
LRRADTHTLGGVENLIALVTGANKGIGIQIARQLAAAIG